MDHSGDFAVVWTSYGQDDPNDPLGAGVYVRLFDRNNIPLTADILVNTTVVGDQKNATVAMDADGDFVVVWEADEPQSGTLQPGDVVFRDIYAQRFNSMGKKVGDQFRVNTNYTNDQWDPAVAMDSLGNFVVVWATAGQSLSYFNDVHGQIYNSNGQKVGSEFRSTRPISPAAPRSIRRLP